MNLKSICDAIAARYAPGTISTPSGAEAMRNSYGQSPHSMPNTPAVVVQPQTGEAVPGSGTWDVTHQVDVEFYLSKSPGDVARVEKQRQLWLPTLLEAVLGQMQLGLGSDGVKSALPTGYEFTTLDYGGDIYDGIVIHLDVIVREPVTYTP